MHAFVKTLRKDREIACVETKKHSPEKSVERFSRNNGRALSKSNDLAIGLMNTKLLITLFYSEHKEDNWLVQKRLLITFLFMNWQIQFSKNV